MSDPFDALRDVPSEATASPDVAAIKGRARRIQQRQRLTVGASAASLAVIALIAVLVSTGPTRPASDLAQDTPAERTLREQVQPMQEDAGASLGTAPEGYEDTTDDEVPAPRAPDSTTTSGQMGAGAGSLTFDEQLTAKVSAEPQPLGGARFTLEVCNTSAERQVRSFGDAQRFDFVVTRDDAVVWAWSDERAFAQMMGEESWEPKACKRWTDAWNGMNRSGMRANNGEYVVEGVLTAQQELRSEPVTFCHGLC